MMISDEQVRRAAEYLQTAERGTHREAYGRDSSVQPELLERVRSVVAGAPELRDDRIERARALLAGPGPSGSEVAEKIIGRAISDAIR